jgi:hypothetical protein
MESIVRVRLVWSETMLVIVALSDVEAVICTLGFHLPVMYATFPLQLRLRNNQL